MNRSRQPLNNPTYYSHRSRPSSFRTEPAKRSSRKRPILFALIIITGLLIINATVIHAGTHKPVALIYTKKQTICIDPGHGGVDPGATSTDGLISERDINLTVALRVKELLNSEGYQVFMTRQTNGASMDNSDRYTFCNNHKSTVLVSIHHNFFDDETVDYDSVLFYKQEDQGLANSIVNATSAKLKITNNGIASFEDGVLSKSLMPAAVSEGFFITSDSEYDQLTAAHSTRLTDEANGIAEGINSYLTNPKAANAAVSNIQVLNRTDD